MSEFLTFKINSYDEVATYRLLAGPPLEYGLRWDVPAEFRNQKVQYAFATGESAMMGEADVGAPWCRRTAPGETTEYFKLSEPEEP